MLSAKVPLEDLGDDRSVTPTYASRGLSEPVSRYEMPEHSMDPASAYQLIHDELTLDGKPDPQPGHLRHHLDGRAGRPVDGRDHEQERHRLGRSTPRPSSSRTAA